jgi:hypothetical protein
MWAGGWPIGDPAQPPGDEPPPATGGSPPVAARRASVARQPRTVGLAVPFGDALVG